MIKKILVLISTLFFGVQANSVPSHVSWTVIGAGPAGIMTIGMILDRGVPFEDIIWVDKKFEVGRMGELYTNVPGNGTVRQYKELLEKCVIFKHVRMHTKSKAIDALYTLDLNHTPKLKILVNALLDVSNYIKKHVHALQDTMTQLDFHDNLWHVKTHTTSFCTDNIVLATGAHPKILHHKGEPAVIDLDKALDKSKLAQEVNAHDSVAVIGSGHSALLVVKHLAELSVSRIINFYNKPIVYPTPMNGGIAWKETGLKGKLATWAKTVLQVNPPKNVIRLISTPEEIAVWLPQCTKVIYAIGFERNELPPINGDQSLYESYNRSTGIIAPRCFGVGIAFAQEEVDPLGNIEELVGLPYLKFEALDHAVCQD